MSKVIKQTGIMEPETIEKNESIGKSRTIQKNYYFFIKMFCLLLVMDLANTVFAQSYTVWKNGSQINSYNTWQEAVYQSSATGNTISQVKDINKTIIYEQNTGSPKYWMFQQNPYPSYSSSNPSDANNFINIYPVTNAIVLNGNGTVYGARTDGKNTIYRAIDGLEADGSYVYKYSVSRSDLLSMTATLDLSQTAVNTNTNSGQQYPENLYIYGRLGWDNWEFIELGFVKSSTGWNGYYSCYY